MRLFIAVFPPTQVQRAAYAATAPLRASAGAVSWVAPDQMHVTMRFLGEADDAQRALAIAAMQSVAAKQPRFGAALGGFAAFPTAKRARVLWIGMMQGSEPMRLMANALEDALQGAGFEPVEESFEPHLTVGRVSTPADWTARLIAASAPEARFQVDRLVLVQSTPRSKGSHYQVIAEAPLA